MTNSLDSNKAPDSQLKILIVDDHLLFAEGLNVLLQTLSKNVETIIHIDGSSCLKLLQTRSNFDLIILDLNIPDVTGLEMLKLFKQRNIICPVLVVSASLDAAIAKQVMENGALGYLGKNASPSEMLQAARTVLSGDAHLDKNLPRVVMTEQNTKSSHSDSLHASSNSIPPRTMEVLKLMARGHSNKAIASLLDISEATVKWHVSRLFEVFDVSNRTTCVAKAARNGLVEIE